MGDDESVRKEVWEGRIPICFMLADEDVGYSVTGERSTPEPTYVRSYHLDSFEHGLRVASSPGSDSRFN